MDPERLSFEVFALKDGQQELAALLDRALLARVQELEKQVAEWKRAMEASDDLIRSLSRQRDELTIELGRAYDDIDEPDEPAVDWRR